MNLSKNNKKHETIMELSLSPLCNETWELSRMIKTLVYTLLPFFAPTIVIVVRSSVALSKMSVYF